MQDCPGNCSYAGACMLWHDAPRGWYEDSDADVAPAPEHAADLASNNASSSKAHDGLAQQRRPPNSTAASEYPQCICFPGLGVSIPSTPIYLQLDLGKLQEHEHAPGRGKLFMSALTDPCWLVFPSLVNAVRSLEQSFDMLLSAAGR